MDITSNIHKLRSFLPNADRVGLGTGAEAVRTTAGSYGVEHLVDQANMAKWEKLAPKVLRGVAGCSGCTKV